MEVNFIQLTRANYDGIRAVVVLDFFQSKLIDGFVISVTATGNNTYKNKKRRETTPSKTKTDGEHHFQAQVATRNNTFQHKKLILF